MTEYAEQNADMAGTYPALCRAARRAAELARMHGALIPIYRDGKIVKITPEEFLAELDAGETENRP